MENYFFVINERALLWERQMGSDRGEIRKESNKYREIKYGKDRWGYCL